MNRVFIDTSAILALLVASDDAHKAARAAFARLRDYESQLVTTSYTLVESYALLGRRIGVDAVERFRNGFSPLLEVTWVDEELHNRGLDLLLQRRPRRLSLVDAVSFVVIRAVHVDAVFAFDRHFEEEGFAMVG